MKMKFHGNRDELSGLLIANGVAGRWEEKPNGVHMMRCPDGANVLWAQGSKSLWCDGKPLVKALLEARVAAALQDNAQRECDAAPALGDKAKTATWSLASVLGSASAKRLALH